MLRAGSARARVLMALISGEARPWIPLIWECRCRVSPRTIVLMVSDRLIEWVGTREVRITDLGRRKVAAEARRTQRVVLPSAAQERCLRSVREDPGRSLPTDRDCGGKGSTMRCTLRP